MAYLDDAVAISELPQGNLWVIYGKSGSGKTEFGSTFPKPMLYIRMGDDGSNTIAKKKGIKAISAETTTDLKGILKELIRNKTYKSVFPDTFSMYVNMWIEENVISKNKKMTQQAWGKLKDDMEAIVRLCKRVAKNKVVILSFHEVGETIDGLEDEILPDVRVSANKGSRTYIEGMSNYGIHTTKVRKTIETEEGEKDLTKYAAHVGGNPYYWTKLQIDSSIKVPKLVINPTYDKIMKYIGGK